MSTPPGAPSLSIYMQFRFLNARQLGELLLGLHGVYEECFYAGAPPFLRQLPNSDSAELRVERAETGQSITLRLGPGITQFGGSAASGLGGNAVGPVALERTGELIEPALQRAVRVSAIDASAQAIDSGSPPDRAPALPPSPPYVVGSERSRLVRTAEVQAVLVEQLNALLPDSATALVQRIESHLKAVETVVAAPNILAARLLTES